MSETDDTDDLLLIPPDFFVLEPEIIEVYATGPYFNIVETLISEVHLLNNRVKSIENFDLLNSTGSTAHTMDTFGKYGSLDEIHRDGFSNSTYSTPQKPRARYRMNSSLPSTPIQVNQQKPVGKFTLERDRYYEKANYEKPNYEKPNYEKPNYEKPNSPQTKFSPRCKTNLKFDDVDSDDVVVVNGKVINLGDIESMLEDIEDQKKATEMRLQEKEQEVFLQKTNTWRTGDDFSTIPPRFRRESTLNGGNEEFLMKKEHRNLVESSKMSSDSVLDGKTGSLSSTDSSQITARCNPNYPQEMRVNSKENAAGDANHDLNSSFKTNAMRQTLRERLEEERQARQLCEKTIQELKEEIMGQRGRLTTAEKVDKSKDRAIMIFHHSWEKVLQTVQVIKEERDFLERQITEMQIKGAKELEECAKKMESFEEKARKAMNLADDCQNEMLTYKNKSHDCEQQISVVNEKLRALEDQFKAEVEKNRQLNEIIIEKELEINQGKNILAISRSEVAQSKNAVELCQVEFSTMKNQYSQLESLLGEKQKAINELEKQKKSLKLDNENLKHLHRDLQEEVKKMKTDAEKTKSELRDFYQKQVESVVKSKLKEFQHQLDKAESSLGEEIKKRELSIAKTAASHIQQLNDKHSLEVNLLEEKHREEVKFYQMQLNQAHQHMESQQLKLKNLQEKRATMAQQLHKVMEAQWLEAVKIINSNKSPFVQQSDETTLSNQLHSLKTKSHNNLEEVLSDRNDDDEINNVFAKDSNGELIRKDRKSEDVFLSSKEMTETPVSSKSSKTKQQVESELQKFIQFILNRSAENYETTESGANLDEKGKERKTSGSGNNLNSNNNKPPWK